MRATSGLAVLLAAGLLCSGCHSTPASPASTTPVVAGPAWIVDHVAAVSGPAAYTAYCVSMDKITPSHLPTTDDLVPVAITENQYRRLQPGDACPGR